MFYPFNNKQLWIPIERQLRVSIGRPHRGKEWNRSRKTLSVVSSIDDKGNLVTIAVPIGDTAIYTEVHLAFRTDSEDNVGLAVHPLRREPQLGFPYMGHKFSPEKKELLLATGNLSKTVEVTPKNGEPW